MCVGASALSMGMAGWDLEVTETSIHPGRSSKEDGNVLVRGIDPGKGCLTQFHEESRDPRLGLDILVIAQCKG